VSATRAEHVLEELGGRVDLILDGGQCSVGLESTIIDCSGEQPRLLRPGAVTREQVETVLGTNVAGQGRGAPRVSGSLPSHYAPRALIEIVTEADLATRAAAWLQQGKRVAVVSRGPAPELAGCEVLRAPADEQAFAHELYSMLRRIDELSCDIGLVTLPEEKGLGAAIADRLRRAAGPR
jgi:L-threonylcarbamoyladenylate synthase